MGDPKRTVAPPGGGRNLVCRPKMVPELSPGIRSVPAEPGGAPPARHDGLSAGGPRRKGTQDGIGSHTAAAGNLFRTLFGTRIPLPPPTVRNCPRLAILEPVLTRAGRWAHARTRHGAGRGQRRRGAAPTPAAPPFLRAEARSTGAPSPRPAHRREPSASGRRFRQGHELLELANGRMLSEDRVQVSRCDWPPHPLHRRDVRQRHPHRLRQRRDREPSPVRLHPLETKRTPGTRADGERREASLDAADTPSATVMPPTPRTETFAYSVRPRRALAPRHERRFARYRYRAPISWTSSLMPGVIVALMVADFR